MAKNIKDGDVESYNFRSRKNAKGTVIGVVKNKSGKPVKVRMRPAPGNNYGEGVVTRSVGKIHKSKLTAKDKVQIKKKK